MENKNIEKMNPKQFVECLEGYFMVVGKAGMSEELENIKCMLNNVDMNCIVLSNAVKKDYSETENCPPVENRSPSIPDKNFYFDRGSSTGIPYYSYFHHK